MTCPKTDDEDGSLTRGNQISSALAAWASSNITAGSDTTSIYLRAMFHYLLTHPDTLAKLRAEIDAVAAAGHAPGRLISWRRARELPYLDACVKEAGRLHPPFGLPYERVVPAEGATVCGKFLPGGTVVGMPSYVVGRDRELFGHDSDEWRPERWLEVGEEERRRMENAVLAVSFFFFSFFFSIPLPTCDSPQNLLTVFSA